MKVFGSSILSLALVAALSVSVVGDEVDDLLAGKPVSGGQVDAPPADAFDSSPLNDMIASPIDSPTLTVEAGWDTLPKAEADAAPKPARDESMPTSDVSLVPEPSAIVLGVAAILYFLVFFRRRQLP